MSDRWLANYPAIVPGVSITPLIEVDLEAEVACPELQWWFAVPRAGDRCGGAWYDRDTGELTRVREAAGPAVDAGTGDGAVQIDIDEWTRDPRTDEPSGYQRIAFVAALAASRAEFRKVTMGGRTVQVGDSGFEGNWSGGGSYRVVDDGRFEPIGERRYRTTAATGMGAGLVELTVGERTFRCLRAFDLTAADGSCEIGQPLIDLASGRTLAYWQYRPAGFDADSASWIATHPGDEMVVDDVLFQRRNCTGRDEIALTIFALGLASQDGKRSTTRRTFPRVSHVTPQCLLPAQHAGRSEP